MEKLCTFLVFVAVLAVISAIEVNRTAVVHLKKDAIEGKITFQQLGSGPVKITGYINGLADGKHGFHIHERGDIANCADAGPHYNPHKKSHGAPADTERHVGDLGNIDSRSQTAPIDFEDDKISLTGEYSIVGRSVVVHEKEDDLGRNASSPETKTTGSAGNRLACGVIGIKYPVDNWPRGASDSSTISALSVGVVSVIAALLSTF